MDRLLLEGRGGVDEIFEALLVDEPTHREDHDRVFLDSETLTELRRLVTEKPDIDAVGHDARFLRGSEREASYREIVATSRHRSRLREGELGCGSEGALFLGQEDIGAMQADDERKTASFGHGPSHRTVRHDPMCMQNVVALFTRLGEQLLGPGDERERRREIGCAPKCYVRAKRFRIAENTETFGRRIAIGAKTHAGNGLEVEIPMRWKHHRELVPSAGEGFGDRSDERRRRISGIFRVGRRNGEDFHGRRVDYSFNSCLCYASYGASPQLAAHFIGDSL